MTKVFQILVPDNTLVSRIISCENQVTELFVIDRAERTNAHRLASHCPLAMQLDQTEIGSHHAASRCNPESKLIEDT